MGNRVSRTPAKLIFWGGAARSVAGNGCTTGEIMLEFPDRIICPADSFYIGRPVPALDIGDTLRPGGTYFVLPVDRFRPGTVLSPASIAALRADSAPKGCPIDFRGLDPFEYVRSGEKNNAVSIKVTPEFIERVISATVRSEKSPETDGRTSICSTPELRKHYEQLVASAKGNEWAPKLETVPEMNCRKGCSPGMRLGLGRKNATRRMRLRLRGGGGGVCGPSSLV